MLRQPKPESPTDAAPGILAVRLGSMGDVIHALPAAATLKHSFPASPLVWLIDPRWSYLLDGNPFVDEVIELDRRSLSSIAAAWRRLRSRRYRIAVDFQGLFKSAVAASAAHPDRIFGFHQSQAREPVAALFYSNRIRVAAAHVVDRNIELAAAAGASAMLKAFPIPPGAAEGDLPEGRFVLACPLAGWPAKQWPLERYSELAGLLRKTTGLRLVLNGPPPAEGALRKVDGVAVHLSGVPGLIHATRRAAAVVGIDSGPLHLAAALEKPGVAVFGPTDPARNGPYGSSITVLRDPAAVTTYKRKQEIDPAMYAISPEAVMKALADRLAVRHTEGASAP